MKKKLYLFALLALSVCGLRAEYVEPSEGVFRIINVEYGSALSEDIASKNISTQTIDEAAYEQLWILKMTDSYYSIQNVYTGRYIQTGNNVGEQPYWTDTTEKLFNIKKTTWGNVGECYNIWDPTLGSVGLHSKGVGERVVRYGSESHKAASEWRFVMADMTLEQAQEIQKQFAELSKNESAFAEALGNYFEDAACTQLKAAYTAMSDEELRATMSADNLPTLLVDMAVKVKGGDWTEANENADKPAWDSEYAKKFRVQLIEPHSIAGEITSWFGHNAHTNMDNPTGLYGNKYEPIFILVEGEIKEGAELWATFLVGHTKMPNYNGGYSNGFRLHSGLNVVPCGADGSAIYLNYLVHTYNNSTKTFPHKLSEYDDLKVHVVGGYINSYYNAHGDALYAADADADWEYYEERANLRNITVVGKHQILQFELNDVTITEDGKTWVERGLAKLFPDELPTTLPEGRRINAIVEAWDRIALSEKITLGEVSKAVVDSMNALYPRWDGKWETKAEMYDYEGYAEYCDGRDYGEYYNHRGVAFGTVSGYMYGSWDHCGYHINTTPSILTKIATEGGPAWGPAHEIGHQHQGLFTVNGLTEVTNNLFSNIAVWYMGFGTSRVNGTEGNLAHVYDNFKTGGDFFGNNIWALTQMYYRLWLYYHRAGNDTQFYPKLFELLRQNPIQKTGYYQAGKTSILHFYQLCCEAAQEDLTEFFRAYGFFCVMNNRLVGDYSNSEYTQSQEDIDAAIAAVKGKNYPVNNKPLFINDCTPDDTYSHDGKTLRYLWDGATGNGTNAEIGSYVDFMAKDMVTGKYLYDLEDLKIKVSGGYGALGFAIYNMEGEILAFSNHHSFAVTEETSTLLSLGEARVVAIAAVEGEVEVPSRAVGGTEEEQMAALRDMVAKVKGYLALTDDTGDKAGMLIPDSTVSLTVLLEKVNKVLSENDQTEGSYGEWCARLGKELMTVLLNEQARVPVYRDAYYTLFVGDNSVYSMNYTSSGLRTTATGATDYANQWLMTPAAEDGTYYLKNRESGYYISAANDGVRAKAAVSSVDEALAFRLVAGEPGEFMLQRTDDAEVYITNNASNRQVTGGQGTWWNLTLADDMLGLPEEGADGKVVIYHIWCVDNSSYLYYNNGKRNGGRVQTSTSVSVDDTNYWFYFTKGGVNGDKYRVYNYATGKSIVLSDGYYYANKDTDVFAEFSMVAAEDRLGLVISNEDGYWSIPGSNLTANTTEPSRFKLIKIGEAINTDIKEAETENTPESDVYYDLTGRVVEKPNKGIYIHNGKKVMIK